MASYTAAGAPPCATVIAAWLFALLLAPGSCSAAPPPPPQPAACTASARLNDSSFGLQYRGARAYSAPSPTTKEPEAWGRYCFDTACIGSTPEARAAFKKTWWSFGDRTKRASAKLLAGGSFLIKPQACERTVWTATEICVNLLDNLSNPCRKPQQLCGEAGCRVTAVTTAFADEASQAPASCCLQGILPHVCEPACTRPDICSGPDQCSSTPPPEVPLPNPLASWTFDECNGTAGALRGDPAGGAVAYLGKRASLERCGGGASAGCVARFDLGDCCADGYAPCWQPGSGKPSCSDWDEGAVATLRGPPGSSSERRSPAALVFDGFTSLTVSAWAKPAVEKVATITGRVWDFPQFAMSQGVGGTWDVTSAAFSVMLECAPGDAGCPYYGKELAAHGGTVPVGRWTHVVGVFGAGEVRLYVDGARVAGPATLPGGAYASAGLRAHGDRPPIFVGGHPAWNVLEGGLVDCVSYYKEPLSDAEVAALHRRERGACGCPAG